MNKIAKKAFTLAEVLITLAIIGVVASLTIPGLIKSQNKSQYVTGLKKAQSVFQQAATKYMSDNGCLGNIDCMGIFASGKESEFANAMIPYLNISKNCGVDTDQDCWSDNEAYLNSTTLPSPTPGDADSVGQPRVILADGMSVNFNAKSTRDGCTMNSGSGDLAKACGTIRVDVNGKKNPNKWGRDVFIFYITHLGRIMPAGTNLFNDDWTSIAYSYAYTCMPETYSEGRGQNCAGRIVEQGWQMNY